MYKRIAVLHIMEKITFNKHPFITYDKSFMCIKDCREALTDDEYLACHIIVRSRQLGHRPLQKGMLIDLGVYLNVYEPQIRRWLKIKEKHRFDIPIATISDRKGSRSYIIDKMNLKL